MNRDAALLAALWWADRLFIDGPQDQRITRRDGTDKKSEEIEFVANFLPRMGSPKRKVYPPTAKEKFTEALADAIEAAPKPLTLSVDYGPDKMLQDAADSCGHRFVSFDWPYKTNMHVKEDGTVRAAHGYGQPFVTL